MKKTTVCLSLFSLVIALPTLAEESANPFIEKADATKSNQPLGSAFASSLENILVPQEMLDDWLKIHPVKDDATELRSAVQGWIGEGKAKLDHTALTLGTVGRKTENISVIEKIYPTEFKAGGADAWPWPTAFETRNLGYVHEGGVSSVDGVDSPWLKWHYTELISSYSFQPLIEQTRKPTDMLLPRFRIMRIDQSEDNTPDTNQDSIDPFETLSTPTGPQGVILKPGAIRLAGRLDPLSKDDPNNNLTRLIFYRGEIGEPTEKTVDSEFEASRISFRVIRVSHPIFSSWLLERSPLSATNELWEVAEIWRKEGSAESLGEVSSTVRESVKNVLENIEPYIFPTEYEPGTDMKVIEQWEEGKKIGGKEGVATMTRYKITPRSGMEGAGLATSFETRNVGNTIATVISNDSQGVSIQSEWEFVQHIGENAYHRIKVGGEWIPDVKFPIFSSNRITSTVRAQPGIWRLLGSGSEFLENEKVDRAHCLLVFVKVE